MEFLDQPVNHELLRRTAAWCEFASLNAKITEDCSLLGCDVM
jgi:hypothetical protein